MGFVSVNSLPRFRVARARVRFIYQHYDLALDAIIRKRFAELKPGGCTNVFVSAVWLDNNGEYT